ncbi:hypothetical protein [Pricia sp.]|uniref:hypothetical protein n=1 Tax=Pricia sp. TaxID=2268138 RepID=UPI00359389A5
MGIFKPDYQNFQGVRPVCIYVLRTYFALMFFVMGYTAWTEVITHIGGWEPIGAVTWCVWAAYATISFVGIYNTLKMLPIAVFMVFYKALWLIAVAYPLWATDSLKGSPPEDLAGIFIWAMVAVPFVPWKHFFLNYVIPTKK